MALDMKARLAATSAPAWIPEKGGDLITGRVINRSTRVTEHGEYEILTIDVDEATVNGQTEFKVGAGENITAYTGGPLAWHAKGGVAKNEVTSADPRPGDEIGVLYDGEKIAQSGPGKGKPYKVFKLVVDHTATPAAPVAENPYSAPAATDELDTEEF